ncbi:unnamed protein product, partial [Porites evermanni]
MLRVRPGKNSRDQAEIPQVRVIILVDIASYNNISETLAAGSCATFLFLSNTDVICDLLLMMMVMMMVMMVMKIVLGNIDDDNDIDDDDSDDTDGDDTGDDDDDDNVTLAIPETKKNPSMAWKNF